LASIGVGVAQSAGHKNDDDTPIVSVSSVVSADHSVIVTHDNVERFSLAGAAHGFFGRESAAGVRAGERKTGWTRPHPRIPRLWALNGPGYFVGIESDVRAGGLAQSVPPAEPLKDRLCLEWDVRSRSARALWRCGASVCTSTCWPVWWRALMSPVLGHDVSGTGWQTMRMGMQSITTMMPA
jgi:hypothetical protein